MKALFIIFILFYLCPSFLAFNIQPSVGSDRDADGLPDSWEDPFGDLDPETDIDSDGIPTIVEFQEGLNPVQSDNDIEILVIRSGWNLLSISNVDLEDQLVSEFFGNKVLKNVWSHDPISGNLNIASNETLSARKGYWVYGCITSGINLSSTVTVILSFNDATPDRMLELSFKEFSKSDWQDTHLTSAIESIEVSTPHNLILENEKGTLDLSARGDITFQVGGTFEIRIPDASIISTEGNLSFAAEEQVIFAGCRGIAFGEILIQSGVIPIIGHGATLEANSIKILTREPLDLIEPDDMTSIRVDNTHSEITVIQSTSGPGSTVEIGATVNAGAITINRSTLLTE